MNACALWLGCTKSLCGPRCCTFGLKACGFLFLMFLRAARIFSVFASVFKQSLHEQVSSQKRPWVKHSQYILRHRDLEHLHARFSTVVLFFFSSVNCGSSAIVACLSIVFLPGPRVLLFFDEDGDSLLGAFFSLVPCSDILRMESFESCLCVMLNCTVFLLDDVCCLVC